jgi:hypothetical protein
MREYNSPQGLGITSQIYTFTLSSGNELEMIIKIAEALEHQKPDVPWENVPFGFKWTQLNDDEYLKVKPTKHQLIFAYNGPSMDPSNIAFCINLEKKDLKITDYIGILTQPNLKMIVSQFDLKTGKTSYKKGDIIQKTGQITDIPDGFYLVSSIMKPQKQYSLLHIEKNLPLTKYFVPISVVESVGSFNLGDHFGDMMQLTRETTLPEELKLYI